ncbi:MAG: sigma-70 family RNA polymerase sigma factor [Planctomycetes bacterium]|nr:sigma-70 family RNA polymerase sigma factor [Planctomycetota bacterium]
MNHAPGPGSSPTGTSSSLLDRVRADEAGAWDRLVALYAPLLYHWCRRWRIQEEDLADVFQEVFKTLVVHLADFRHDRKGATFRGWLFTITRNKVLDHFRRKAHDAEGAGGTEGQQRLAQIPAPDPVPESEPEEAEAIRALYHRGLKLIEGEFEPQTWKAFWKTAVEGRAPREVAAELSMTPGAVRVAKSRVLQRLREELGDAVE